MRKVAGLLVVVAMFVAGSWIAAQETPPPAEPKSRLIMGFENEDELMGVEILGAEGHEYITDKKYVTQGEAALKLKVKKGEGGYGIEFTPMSRGKYLAGWEKFDMLVVDVYNLGDKDEGLAFRFDDDKSKAVATRAHFLKTLRPGANVVKIPLKGLTRDNGEEFDIAGLKRFIPHFWNPKDDFEVVFDNMRLEKE
jgi:hypothetical protein